MSRVLPSFATPRAFPEPEPLLTRRDWLRRAGGGFGLIGLAGLLQDQGYLTFGNVAQAAESRGERALGPMTPRPSHFPARAKRVIWVFINGGPSQVDTWDYKPEL